MSWVPFCSIGDVVEFVANVAADVDGDQQRIDAGARYVVDSVVEAGWNLRRLSGTGPDEVRILNSEMPKFVVRV